MLVSGWPGCTWCLSLLFFSSTGVSTLSALSTSRCTWLVRTALKRGVLFEELKKEPSSLWLKLWFWDGCQEAHTLCRKILSAKLLIEEARKSISKQGHKANAPALWFDVIGSNKKERRNESRNDERKKSELKLMNSIPWDYGWSFSWIWFAQSILVSTIYF